jgi:hypothetical protein
MSQLPDLTKVESKWLSARHSAHRAHGTAFAVKLPRRGQGDGDAHVLADTARSLQAYADLRPRRARPSSHRVTSSPA